MNENEKRLELIKKQNKLSLLNKIKHKPNLLLKIFPFITNRPFILPYLLDLDPVLRNSLKNTLNNMKSKKFSSELIDIIHKFMTYNLMKGITKDYLAKYVINLFFNELEYNINFDSLSFLDYNNKYIFKCFKDKPIPSNININHQIIEKHIPKGSLLNNFQNDYFFNETVLFYTPLQNYVYCSFNKDINYINDLNKKFEEKKIINLICIIPINFCVYYKYMIKTNYKYINKLYFIYYDESFYDVFNKVEFYLNLIKHKENIKYIYFDKNFTTGEKKGKKYFEDYIIYKKIILEYLVDDYFVKIENNEKINFNLNSFENIEYDDDNLINDIQVFRLRYNLNKIFKGKNLYKLIVITPDDYNNILNFNEEQENYLNKKLHKFYNEETKYKILYLNFNNNSPYNKNFAYFCEKYLYYNKYINIIIIDNIGNINKDDDFFNSMENIKKLKFPNLKCIIFEDEIFSNNINEIQKEKISEKNNNDLFDINYDLYNNELLDVNFNLCNNEQIIFVPNLINLFITDFFDISNFNIYEGCNDENYLLYFKIAKYISIDELYRIFFLENKISYLRLKKENINIKYNKNKKELNLVYIVNNKEKQLTYQIKDFTDFFYKLNKIMDLYFYNGEIIKITNNYSDKSEEEEKDERKEKENKKNNNSNEDNTNEIDNFINSEILSKEKEFSLLNEGISEIEGINDISKLEFNLIYRAKSDKNKIDKIIEKIGKNKYMLIIIKTNKGNIFGTYAYFYDFCCYNKEDRKFGVVFNFTKEKLFYDVEGLIYKNDQGIEVKNYFYITKPSFGLKNKIINNSMEIEESNFTCAKMEVYDVS